jgi:hypothetical protein
MALRNSLFFLIVSNVGHYWLKKLQRRKIFSNKDKEKTNKKGHPPFRQNGPV